MKRLMLAICILGILILLGIVGAEDFETQQEIEVVHCENVAAGLYKDYRGVCDDR